MRTFKDKISVGILGQVWDKKTCDIIKGARICDHVSVFQYPGREALFIDQYDFFLVTDFGQNPHSDWDFERLVKLNEMREILASRSMRTTVMVNWSDPNIASSAREVSSKLIRLDCGEGDNVASVFASKLVHEVYGMKPSVSRHHDVPVGFLEPNAA